MGHHTNFYYPVKSGPTVTNEHNISYTPYKWEEDMRFYDCFGVGSEHDETILRGYERTIEFLNKNYHYFKEDYEDEDLPELEVVLRGKVKQLIELNL